MIVLGVIFVAILWVVNQGNGDGTGATASPSATPGPGYITREEYGRDWPFSVPAGTLACYDGAAAGGGGRINVTFTPRGSGIEYGLNGSARDFGFPDLDRGIMPAWPNTTGLLDLIQRGLDLC
jgi:hypothetical protein